MAATYIPIQSITLSASAASVTFSDIPQTYSDLVIRCSIKDSTTTGLPNALTVRMNGVGTSVYSYTFLHANAGTPASARASSAQEIRGIYYVTSHYSATPNTFNSVELYVAEYTKAAAKPVSIDNGYEINATGSYGGISAGLYQQDTAITSVSIIPGSNNWVANCTFHLYGIKNT